VRLHCSFIAACRLIFELTRLILTPFVRQGTAGAQAFSAGARAPAGPGLAPPLAENNLLAGRTASSGNAALIATFSSLLPGLLAILFKSVTDSRYRY